MLFGVKTVKYNKIVLFFGIAYPASLLLRILQLFFTIETKTGFFKNEYKSAGMYLLLLIVAVCVALGIICFTSHRNPEHPPKTNPLISVCSAFLAVMIGAGLVSESFAGTVMKWQMNLLFITGFAAVVYFLFYSISGFLKINIPNICTIIPSIYLVLRIICTFSSISSLALISDNLIILSAYCVSLLFFICFGKLYNKIDTEANFRKIMAYGLVATVLCFTQSIPHIIINLVNNNSYQHTPNSTNLELLAAGLFISVFTFSYFSLSNFSVKHRHTYSVPDDKQFYTSTDKK